MEPIDVVIDTDIGADPDDAIAVALAVASPELRVRGVTIVSGDVDWRARIATRLLGMIGRPDVPVIRGIGASGMLGIEGRGILDLEWSGVDARIVEGDAVDWLIEQSRLRPFHLIAIGPLTNVAEAIRRDSGFIARLHGLSVMGGVLDPAVLPDPVQQEIAERGIPGGWPDYNTMSDPVATLAVADSDVAIDWITTDVTFTVPLSRDALAHLPPGHSFTAAVRGMVGSWDSFRTESGTSIHGAVAPDGYTDTFLHDPLAVASLWHDEWLTMTPMALRYAIDDQVFRLYPDAPAANNARVSTRVDGDRFASLCMKRIADHITQK